MAADKSLFQLHAESAQGALEDAGLTKNDIDGYFCASGDNARSRRAVDGRLPRPQIEASRFHRCRRVVLPVAMWPRCEAIARQMFDRIDHLGGSSRAEGVQTGTAPRVPAAPMPESGFDCRSARPPRTCTRCARCGTCTNTHDQRAACLGQGRCSHHAQYNPHAMLRDVVTGRRGSQSPMIADRCTGSIAA